MNDETGVGCPTAAQAYPNIETLIAGLPTQFQFMASAFMASKMTSELDQIERELPELLAEAQPAIEAFSETGDTEGVTALLKVFGVDDETGAMILDTLRGIRQA